MSQVLLLETLQPDVMEALEPRFRLHRLDQAADPDTFLDEVGPGIRGLAVGAMAPVDAALMARLPCLEIVANLGVGYDTINVREAARRGIIVANTPDVLSDEVADLTIGLLIATLREIPRADRYLRVGRWAEAPYPLTATLRGRRVGILGLGRIGRAIARRLEGFAVEIDYFGRRRQDGVPYRHHARLIEMAQVVDVLILSAPGGPDTDRIVDAAVLEALGSEGVLVNVARGSLVDEAALIAALRSGTILSAGLDVFTTEPEPSPDLVALDNAVLLPHVGSASVRTRRVMGQLLVDNLISWFEGRGALTPVPETPTPTARAGVR